MNFATSSMYSLKDKAEAIKLIVKRYVEEENFELADDVISEVEESRKRHKKEFISPEEMRKEFG